MKTPIPPGIFGPPTETEIIINGKKIPALIDTGSTVSTISESFYNKELSQSVDMKTLDNILQIECAGGTQLPYKGYIEVNLEIPKNISHTSEHVMLVVPDSKYSQQIPALIGTNVLESMMQLLKEEHGVQYLQNLSLTTPWYFSFRCLKIRENLLRKKNYRLAVVRTVNRITLPPNSVVDVNGYYDEEIPYHKTSSVLQSSTLTPDFKDIDITNTLRLYSYKQNGIISVKLSNVTTRTITVPPKQIICEVQPVIVENLQPWKSETTEFLDEVDITESDLTTEQLQSGKDLLLTYSDIFSKGDNDVGHTDMVKHRIDLTDDTPFKQRYRRIPSSMYDEVRSHLRQLLDTGIIRPSHSPYASNVVLVRKKNGTLRMCVDYRQLNKMTRKDSYALPRIEELLDCLSGNKFFSHIDMKSGYHQVEIYEDHKERTAFSVGPLGFFEYNRMPFGLTNSPATYQRLMENLLTDYNLNICCVFIDDIIIFGKTFEEHLQNIKLVFNRIREAHLKISPGKCEFFKRKVKFIGHVVSEEGVEMDPDKTERVINWPKPKTPEEVRKFLGFVGYYRRFIENFSRISRPLTDLMPTPMKKTKRKTKTKEWKWGEPQDQAFETLKKHLTSSPILGYANSSLPYELHTDASGDALGAVLYQQQNGHKRVISYASRGLNKAEKNYPPHKREFLALKWAICDKFKDYLYGQQFTVFTDNNPVTYVLTTAKLDATGHRWLAALAAFNFDIKYRPGRSNADADALSRLPMSIETVQAICNSATSSYVESLTLSSDVILNDIDPRGMSTGNIIDWEKAQSLDPDIHHVIEYVRNEQKPPKNEIGSNPLLRQFNHLKLIEGVLHRVTHIDEETRHQLVLPIEHASTVLEALHDDMGHPGKDRTLSLIRDRFYWPGMHKDIETWIEECGRCTRRKTPTNQRAPLVNITTTSPLELVCMDFLTLEPCKGGYKHILVITDHFTRFAMAIPTRNQLAKTTAEMFYNNFIVHYGIPERIHSDQGANFESRVIQELCKIMGMKKSRTTSYHAMGNGMCERFNRTLLNMLGSLDSSKKTNWKAYVKPFVHAYNCTRHESTGQTPYLLMFGNNPRLPVDAAFGLRVNEKEPSTQYIKDLRERIIQAHKLATAAAEKARNKQKECYNSKIRGGTVKIGDRVLVKIVAFEGKHKLADRWEPDPYIVIGQPNENIPVFVVKKENGEGRRRTLHRNLLLPIGILKDTPTPQLQKPIPVKRKSKILKKEPTINPTEPSKTDDFLEHSSEDESEWRYAVISQEEQSDNNSNIIGESQVQTEADQDPAETQGDAHSSRDTVSVEEDISVRDSTDSSATQSETNQEEAPDNQDASHTESEDEETQPMVPLRRSTRERRLPLRYRTGDFQISKSMRTATPDWKERIHCLTSLAASSPLLEHLRPEAGKAILDILTSNSVK